MILSLLSRKTGIRTFLLTAISLNAGGLACASTTWTGVSGDGAFTTPGNWTAGIPSVSNDAVFADGGADAVTVSGASEIDVGGVGANSGNVTLTLAGGTLLALDATNNGTLSVASGAGLTVNGPGSLTAAAVIASGTMTLAAAVTASGQNFEPASPNSSSAQRNAILVQGGGTLDLASGADVLVQSADTTKTLFLRVGYADTQTDTLNIAAGANLQVGQAARYANFHIGDGAGASGVVNQTGGTVTTLGSLNIGVDGGTGVYNVSGGVMTVNNADDSGHTSLVTLGLNLNAAGAGAGTSSGTLNISGGTVDIITNLYDGTHYGSSELILGNRLAGNGAGNGTITQTGGVLYVDNHAGLYLSSYGDGVYNLTGGTLQIGASSLNANYGNGGGTYAFNLGGGTIQVTGSDLTTSVNANLVGANSVSTIDTNGFNATWSGNLTAAGLFQNGAGGTGLNKAGQGTLTLSGNNTLDTAWVTGGAIRQTGGSITSVELAVGSGVTSGVGNTGAFLMDGGTLTINPSNAGLTSGSFRVGDYGGTGTFTQTAGTVTVTTDSALSIGNQGGSGTYNLQGGTVNLQGGTNVLGRSTAGNAASSGALNISGGELNVTDSGSLINGNNIAPGTGVAEGAGTITQTGGILYVDNTSLLAVAGHGDGVYNLEGGVLEIGGSSFVARYNNTTASSVFNFGGGTIQVTGSDLTTGVNANLVGTNAVSTIDTNGFDATWSGDLTAAGLHQAGNGGTSFVKTGLGTLTLSGATRTLDSAFVTGGIINQTAGATTAVELAVGSGTGAVGSFTLSGGTLTIDASTRTDNITAVSGSFRVGDYGGSGTFTQAAGALTVADNGALDIGNQGGSGTYNLEGGTVDLNSGLHVIGRSTGANPASRGVLNISGGTFSVHDGGELVLGNNTQFLAGTSSTINQSGGTLNFDAGTGLFLSAYTAGTYNLTGGTLQIGGSSLKTNYGNGGGTYAFNLGGGTIQVTGSDLITSVNANLVGANAVSTIDTNGFNATWSGDLTAAGLHQVGNGGTSFIKTGLGTLTLSGATRTLDSGFVTGGAINQTAGDTTTVEFAVASGTGTTGAFTLSGGTLTVDASTLADGTTPVAGTLRVGDFGGTGLFTQTAGTVTITENASLNIGNQGGSGTYDLEGGTLNIGGILNTIGRSTVGKAASTGTLNFTGGALNVVNGASLILGNNITGGPAGSGTLNQSGGTLTVDGTSSLWISGYGAGTYNLSGGTLVVGGSSLQSNYGNGTGVSTFNLSGGVIQISGSDLTTPVNATLTAGTISTIDTNGFNAKWNGAFGGPGSLIKTGAGSLNFGATDTSLGLLTLSSGEITGNNIATTGYTVESGAITANLSGGALTKNTAGTVSLAGNNTYSDTTLNAGTLLLLSANALSAGNVTLNAGTLDLGGFTATAATVTLSGGAFTDGTLVSTAGFGTTGSSDTVISGNLGGAAAFTQAGSGVTTLSGDDSGYSGRITVTAGTLAVDSANALGTGAVTLTAGTLRIDTSATASNLSGTGGVVAITAPSTVFTVNNTTANTYAGSLTGAGTFAVTGSSTLTLAGSDSGFAGTTTVGSGANLVVGTSVSPETLGGRVNIAAGGTLSGFATFTGAVTVNGAHNLGSSPGSQTFLSGLSYGAGSVLTMNFLTPAGPTATAGVDFDRLTITGGLTIASGVTLTLAKSGAVDYSAAFWSANHNFQLLEADSITGAFVFDDSGAVAGSEGFGDWTLVQNGTSVTADWTVAVPEPSYHGLAGAGVLVAAVVARRRRKTTGM